MKLTKTFFLLVTLSVAFMVDIASASILSSRLVSISTSLPSAIASHGFSFDLKTAGSLGSIEFEYCTNNPFAGTACVAPDGLNLASSTLSNQSGETGFTIDGGNTTANRLVITRVASPATPQAVAYNFSGIVNPSTAKQTVYVRISTFASSDASGFEIDTGSVALSTSGSLGVGGYVPPYLTMCVGITVAVDCSSSAGSLVGIGELSTNSPRSGESQFAVATNDPAGYAAYVTGTTLTSGNNTIPALTVSAPSNPGTGQFGINLRANTSPPSGDNTAGAGAGAVSNGYNNINEFKFISGDQIAASTVSTEFNRFTVTYLVNISLSQPAGVYTSTMTYIAVAAF